MEDWVCIYENNSVCGHRCTILDAAQSSQSWILTILDTHHNPGHPRFETSWLNLSE